MTIKLLTDEQEAQLSQQIQDLRQEKNIDIVIVTKNGLGEKVPPSNMQMIIWIKAATGWEQMKTQSSI